MLNYFWQQNQKSFEEFKANYNAYMKEYEEVQRLTNTLTKIKQDQNCYLFHFTSCEPATDCDNNAFYFYNVRLATSETFDLDIYQSGVNVVINGSFSSEVIYCGTNDMILTMNVY